MESNCELILTKEMNSICVIDGQHRIYAHYVSGVDSKQERRIAELRQQLHLLVTGLVFDKDVKAQEFKVKFLMILTLMQLKFLEPF